MEATSNQAEQVLNYFKEWLPSANRVYQETLRSEQEQAERRERETLKQQIAKEEERADVLRKLKI